MASKYYAVNNLPTLYDQPDQITVGTSTGSTDIEVRVDTGKSWTREGMKIALESIIRRITERNDASVI